MKIDLSRAELERNTNYIRSAIGAIGGANVGTETVKGADGGKAYKGTVALNPAEIASTVIGAYKTSQDFDLYKQGLMAEVEKHKLLPDNATMGSTNATLLGYNMFTTENVFTRYNIKAQFAQRIDQYFDMFGYLTNTLKIPNINNRPNWNYIKLAGANLLGEIPEADLQEIKGLFNDGITLWHNATTFLDYSQNNR